VARLYQLHTGELVVREYDDVKQHWIEKCCNKFKKPTGNPGDPKRDMILRCQRIQEQIHEKSSSLILGVDSRGDTGLRVSTDADNDKELEEENGLKAELVVVADNPGVAGSTFSSRTATPNALLEVGVGVIALEQVEAGIPSVPPLPTTQQFTEGNYGIPQQQLILSLEAMYLSQQQRAHQVITQQSVQPVMQQSVQPMVVQPMLQRLVQPTQQQPVFPMQQPKKKAKKSSESSLSNEKTKNSLSEKRGSIVKSRQTGIIFVHG
jgi:hypothetical protein